MNIHENNINLCDPNFVGNGCGPLAIQKFLKNLLKLEIFGSITPLEKRTVRICKVRPSILFVSTIFGGRQRIRRLAPVLAKALLLRHLPRRPAGDLSAPKKGVCIADAFFGERLCAARGSPPISRIPARPGQAPRGWRYVAGRPARTSHTGCTPPPGATPDASRLRCPLNHRGKGRLTAPFLCFASVDGGRPIRPAPRGWR